MSASGQSLFSFACFWTWNKCCLTVCVFFWHCHLKHFESCVRALALVYLYSLIYYIQLPECATIFAFFSYTVPSFWLLEKYCCEHPHTHFLMHMCRGFSRHSLGKCFEPQAHRKKCIFTMTQYTTPQTCCLHTLLKQFYYIMNNKGKWIICR